MKGADNTRLNVRIIAIAIAATVLIALVAIYVQSLWKAPTSQRPATSTTITSSIASTSAYTIGQQQVSLATSSLTTPIPSSSSLRIAISTDLSTLDIHFAKAVADFEVLGKVYEALFKIMWDGSRLAYVPWLVKEHKQINETTWLFVLRDDVYFHNGKKLVAEDVKYSLLRSLRLSGIGKQLLTDASGNSVIRDIVVVNETAFIIVLSAPFTPLFENLAHLSTAIMPKEIALKYWKGPINSTEDIIGTGPYRLVSYERGSKVILQVFDGYWGKKPSARELVYMVMPDANTRIAAIASGFIDIVIGISPDMVDYLKSKGIEVIRAPGVRLVLVAVNCERVPDARVRQALNYAIDKEAIVSQLLKGYATIAASVASPVFPNVYSFEPYTYNTTLARKMLEEAGFVGKKLTLLVSTRSPMDIQLAQVVQYYLKAVGIDVEIVQMEHTAFLK
ncbi:MAG: ABC transporter substrate-binding protein, partial [Desulfurococcaceae archaeon]|nr:ABC transporter substrate-binding protein [Desulfurococcaceae archaeon]